MSNDQARTGLRLILIATVVFAGACTQQKAPTSSPASSATSPAPSPRPSAERHNHAETGRASWYGKAHQGKLTASGEKFDMHALTAAHRTLPFGTVVRVKNVKSGKSVNVRINDRGPFRKDRIIDVSYG